MPDKTEFDPFDHDDTMEDPRIINSSQLCNKIADLVQYHMVEWGVNYLEAIGALEMAKLHVYGCYSHQHMLHLAQQQQEDQEGQP